MELPGSLSELTLNFDMKDPSVAALPGVSCPPCCRVAALPQFEKLDVLCSADCDQQGFSFDLNNNNTRKALVS